MELVHSEIISALVAKKYKPRIHKLKPRIHEWRNLENGISAFDNYSCISGQKKPATDSQIKNYGFTNWNHYRSMELVHSEIISALVAKKSQPRILELKTTDSRIGIITVAWN